MAKKTKASIAEAELKLSNLIDERLQLVETMSLQAKRKEQLGNQITEICQELGIKEAFGKLGGYRLSEILECEYHDGAYAYAARNGLAGLFTPAMKITYSKVMDANKKNQLTNAQYNRLQLAAGELQEKIKLTSICLPEEPAADE